MRASVFIDAAAAAALVAFALAACDSSDASGPNDAAPDAGAPVLDASSGDGARGTDASSAPDAEADGGGGDAGSSEAGSDAGAMTVTSTAFVEGGTIPAVHSFCDGDNASIPVAWSGAPAGTMSFAVVMRDRTLGGANNYHWVLYDVPASVTSLAQGVPKDTSPDPPGGGAKQTRWSFGAETGFQGMCPIVGPMTHEYELAVYAIDVATLPAPGDPADPAAVDVALGPHRLATGTLRGTYTKQ